LHLISPVIYDPLLSQTLYPNIFNKEVFPHPLAPIIDISYPGFANPEIPNNTYFFFPPFSILFGKLKVFD
jgi:hypothetical protein